MELIARRLSAVELRAVLDEPSTASTLLYGDLNDEDAEMPDPELDLDKSWHAIHYLLTGTAWDIGDDAAGAAILGGDEVGEDDEDDGYGPARLLDPESVRAIADALDTLDPETLRARLDPTMMAAAEIYPNVWTDGTVDFDNVIAPHFAELRRFYRSAATEGHAVLIAIA
jgi:hypothetical protein